MRCVRWINCDIYPVLLVPIKEAHINMRAIPVNEKEPPFTALCSLLLYVFIEYLLELSKA